MSKQINWKKVAAEVRGASATWRKGIGFVSIHDYGEGRGAKRFHVDYIGVQEGFASLPEAKKYGNNFVVFPK